MTGSTNRDHVGNFVNFKEGPSVKGNDQNSDTENEQTFKERFMPIDRCWFCTKQKKRDVKQFICPDNSDYQKNSETFKKKYFTGNDANIFCFQFMAPAVLLLIACDMSGTGYFLACFHTIRYHCMISLSRGFHTKSVSEYKTLCTDMPHFIERSAARLHGCHRHFAVAIAILP